ncbi:MAG: hypothetical protein KME27_05595 [Lyngbya sp. HA4199-MV5]|nr:hypothetical protein [Lyngbya sp. HA4199-MV5]
MAAITRHGLTDALAHMVLPTEMATDGNPVELCDSTIALATDPLGTCKA